MRAINRLIAMLALIIMVALSACSFALADAAVPSVYLRSGQDEDLMKIWAERLGLDQPLKYVERKAYDVEADRLKDYKSDFYTISTSFTDPQELFQAGVLEPFEPTETMLVEIAAFPEFLQQLFRESLTTSDGKLLGYPVAGKYICERPNFIGYWIPDAWAASPFKNMTPPTCFEEMLDFLDLHQHTA